MNRFRELDALRGLAALYVMVHHYFEISSIDFLPLKTGATGVDLFFLISGFVILLTLEKTKTARDFIISRLSRLYPSYITMIFLTCVIIFFFYRAGMPDWKQLAGNLTMLQPIFRTPLIDESYWTLSVEMQFYIFMLFLFMSGKLKYVEQICFAFLLIVLAYYWVASHYFFESKIYIIPRAYFPLINHFELFLAGIVFYKIKTDGWKAYRIAILAICLLSSFWLFDMTGRAHIILGIRPYITAMCVYFTLFILFVRNRLGFLNIPVLTWFGTISYCIYLFHMKTGLILYYYLTLKVGIPGWAALISLMALVIAVAALVTFYVEKPVIKWIKNRFLISRTPAPRAELV